MPAMPRFTCCDQNLTFWCIFRFFFRFTPPSAVAGPTWPGYALAMNMVFLSRLPLLAPMPLRQVMLPAAGGTTRESRFRCRTILDRWARKQVFFQCLRARGTVGLHGRSGKKRCLETAVNRPRAVILNENEGSGTCQIPRGVYPESTSDPSLRSG
jgi:hypothetical protein